MSQELLGFYVKSFDEALSKESNSKLPLNTLFLRIKEDLRKISLDDADKVRESVYDLDNILIECQALSKKYEGRKSCMNCYSPKDLLNLKKNKDKLRVIKKLLQDLKKDSGERSPSKRDSERNESVGRYEWSYGSVDTSKIYGWKEEVQDISEVLLRGDSDLNLVGIVGNFGTGKTALAQKIFMSDDVMDGFALRLWVCVSPDCDPEELVRRMLDNLGVEDVDSILEIGKDKKTLGVLLFLLYLQLLDKRYLIVFDDCNADGHAQWYSNLKIEPPEDDREWTDHLAYGLPKGNGNAIIVTSRSQEFAVSMVGRQNIHHPPRLDENNGWLLFKSAYEEVAKGNGLRSLESLKTEITHKCDRHPLALRTAGMELARQHVEQPKDGDTSEPKSDDTSKNKDDSESKVDDTGKNKDDSEEIGKPELDDTKKPKDGGTSELKSDDTSKNEDNSESKVDDTSKNKDDSEEIGNPELDGTKKPKDGDTSELKSDDTSKNKDDSEDDSEKISNPELEDTKKPKDDDNTKKPKDGDTSKPKSDDTSKNKDDSEDDSEKISNPELDDTKKPKDDDDNTKKPKDGDTSEPKSDDTSKNKDDSETKVDDTSKNKDDSA